MSLTCQDVTLLLTDYQEKAIPWHERLQVKLHLGRCSHCQGLVSDLKALPELIQRGEPTQAELAPLAERALAGALQQLGRRRMTAATPVPEPLQDLLAAGADLPLRILAQVHEAMFGQNAPRQEPYLPQEVLAQLPSPESWKWTPSGRLRRAVLAVDPTGGQRLSILYAPPKCQIPAHTHLGTESLLVLEGEMEDRGRCLGNGHWIHLEDGSSHAPYVFEEGCWCLIRDEGTVQYDGPFKWLSEMASRVKA